MKISYAEMWSVSPSYCTLCEYIRGICENCPHITYSVLGESILGREIPMLSIGNANAEKSVVYVGTHHALEWVTTSVLLRFTEEFAEICKNGGSIYGIDINRMLGERRITVIPMLNPDGFELHLHGMDENFVLYERLIKMCGGDFSHWQSNARGVDLNHNYNAGFREYKQVELEMGIAPGNTKYSGESPESEPEVAAMCRLLRYDSSVTLVLSLHTQGEEIYYGNEYAPTKSRRVGRLIQRMCGYRLSETSGTSSYGGLCDWFVREIGQCGFTLECGKGINPLAGGEYFGIYTKIREVLFSAPYMC